MRRRNVRLVVLAVATTAALVACTLNPQPLPPGDESAFDPGSSFEAGAGSDSGFGQENPPAAAADASPTTDELEGGSTGDGGEDGGAEAGDAGDAAPDAG